MEAVNDTLAVTKDPYLSAAKAVQDDDCLQAFFGLLLKDGTARRAGPCQGFV